MTRNDKQPLRLGTHISVTRDVVLEVVERGHSKEEFCKKIGIAQSTLDQEDYWVSLEENDKVWREALNLTQDPNFGVNMGQKVNRAAMGSLIGSLVRSCPDLLTACYQAFEFQQLLYNIFTAQVKVLNQKVVVSFYPVQAWKIKSPDVVEQVMDYCMIHTFSVFRVLSGRAILPDEASFAHLGKKDNTIYQQILGEKVSFGQTDNSLLFDLADLHTPVITSNSNLKIQFEALAHQLLLKENGNTHWTRQVLKVLETQPLNKLVTLQEVSSLLHVTPRSLQRKLSKEGTNFQEIISQVQKQRAIVLLKNMQLSISEIAYMLGYTEPSTFTRAFKSWTGKTPSEYLDQSSSG